MKESASGIAPTYLQRGGVVSYLSLFTSLGTLLCCALPSLLVLFGLGATVATVLSEIPWLVSLSRHKNWVFLAAGLLISSNFVYVYGISPRLRAGGQACDLKEAAACSNASKLSQIVLWVSAAVYLIGSFSAYVLGPILIRFD